MKKTRFAVKAFAATLAATVLVLGSVSAPAQAKDTGWGPRGVMKEYSAPTLMKEYTAPTSMKEYSAPQLMRDTGWGPV